MSKKITKEVEHVIRWLAAEFKYLRILHKALERIEQEGLPEQERELKKDLRVARYIGRAELRVEHDIQDVLEELKGAKAVEISASDLHEVLKEIEVPANQLVTEGSQYVGGLRKQLKSIRTDAKVAEKYPDDAHRRQVRREIRRLEAEIADLEEWIAALDAALGKAKVWFEYENSPPRRKEDGSFDKPIISRFENVLHIADFLDHGYRGKEAFYRGDGRGAMLFETHEDAATMDLRKWCQENLTGDLVENCWKALQRIFLGYDDVFEHFLFKELEEEFEHRIREEKDKKKRRAMERKRPHFDRLLERLQRGIIPTRRDVEYFIGYIPTSFDFQTISKEKKWSSTIIIFSKIFFTDLKKVDYHQRHWKSLHEGETWDPPDKLGFNDFDPKGLLMYLDSRKELIKKHSDKIRKKLERMIKKEPGLILKLYREWWYIIRPIDKAAGFGLYDVMVYLDPKKMDGSGSHPDRKISVITCKADSLVGISILWNEPPLYHELVKNYVEKLLRERGMNIPVHG
tara:strand:+ start:1358 stop:2902 length:1545 start_codon:yes stop_codon:yes gene_type:complete